MPRIETISAGLVAPLWVREDHELRSVMSGIKKSPISTLAKPCPIEITASGIASDEQADHWPMVILKKLYTPTPLSTILTGLIILARLRRPQWTSRMAILVRTSQLVAY